MALSNNQLSSDVRALLQASLTEAQQRLQDAAVAIEFEALLEAAFGSLFSREAGATLQRLLAAGSLDWPEIELRSAEELQGALGAYGLTTGKIYLSEALVANVAAIETTNASERLTAVLLEELGHHLDVQLNAGRDAAGDEGAIFSALVRGEVLDEARLTALRTEHDQGLLQLDGQSVAVEFASFVVTNANDSGAGSLRDAIAQANLAPGADTITFDPSLNDQTITLTSDELLITDDLTIDGDLDDDGAPDITVARDSGAADFRIFNVDDGDNTVFKTVELEGLTITGGQTPNGSGESGGGIFNRENLALINSVVSDNATGPGSFSRGGGIYSRFGELTLTNSTVSGNSTQGKADAYGGGIYVDDGTLTLNDSTVSGNFSQGSRGDGGGIFSEGSTVTLNNSSISNNFTTQNFVDGGGLYATKSEVTLNNSTVSGNFTQGVGAGGGGIITFGGSLTLNSSTVSGNSTAGVNSEGGGIANSGGDISVSNSTVSGNFTTGDNSYGGGISSSGGTLIVSNSTVNDNSTAGTSSKGGGIFSLFGDLSVSNSAVSGNSTTGNYSRGGGIYSYRGDVSVSNSTVSGNSTAGNFGGGGGIYSYRSDLSMSNSTVSGNFTEGSNADGGGIFSEGPTPITLNNSIVSGNEAQNANGDEIRTGSLGSISSSNNVLGDSSKTDTEAFVRFTPGATDITATSDGTNPTALSYIIAPLANNGGNTQTHALVAGSPAINAGNNTNTPADSADQDSDGDTTEPSPFDQRGPGFERIADGTVDAGAVEFPALPVVSITATDAEADENSGDTATYQVTRSGGDISQALTVELSLGLGADLTASDFTLSGGGIVVTGSTATVTIPAGQTSVDITLTANDDAPAEAAEALTLTVNVTPDYDVDASLDDATATILANDTFVTNTNDSGEGSLRQAILNANDPAVADNNRVDFDPSLSGQTITLTSGELLITDDLTIDGDLNDDGAPDITVARDNTATDFRIFNVDDGDDSVAQTVVLDGLTITGGRTTADFEEGGGIRNRENLTVSNSVVSGNSTMGERSGGGGIQSKDGGLRSSSSLIVVNSTISDNFTEGDRSYGGGINSSFSDVSVINSTVSGNFTKGDRSGGGGIVTGSLREQNVINSTVSDNFTEGEFSAGGGIFSYFSSLAVSNSTVSGNSTAGDNSDGGGVFSEGDIIFNNSIVSGNVAQNSDGDEIRRSTGSTSTSNNIFGDSSKTNAEAFDGFTPSATDITATSDGTNPTALSDIIAPLANNGGNTETHALVAGSPAINAGNNANIPADSADQDSDGNTTEPSPFDQRGPGFERINSGPVDAGAFEAQNAPPVITSLDAATVDENQTSAIDVDAIDDAPGVSFSLTGGDDAALFNIDSATGEVTFKTAPDFENPIDAGGNNIYDIQVTATDAGGLTDVQDIAITVANVNEAPTIDSSDTVTIPENQTAVINVESSDPDGETEGSGLTYSLSGGVDQSLFAIDPNTGALSFLSAPDFENPADIGSDNLFDVQVTVSDAGGLTDVQDIAVTVSDVIENGAPVITSPDAVTVDENQTSVIDVDAIDDAPGVSFSLTGGDDAALFNIDSTTGAVTFKAAPDFETPVDADGNNIYDIQVTATDSGGLTDIQDIAITVTDEAENLTLTIDPGSISENGGIATGTLTRDGDLSAALSIDLSSDDTSEATVPASITIPAGQSSANFDIASVDDAILDGTQTVTITAAAEGFPDLTDTLEVTDDDIASGLIFKLFDAASDTEIATLVEGGSINLSQIPNQDLDSLNVQVLAPDFTNAESASLALNGQGVQNENVEPFALFGDARGDFFAGTISLGANSIEAKIFSQDGQVGLLAEEIRSFTIVDDTPPPLTSGLIFKLFDAASDTAIATLTEGGSINLSQIPNQDLDSLSVQVLAPSFTNAESASLALNGQGVQNENVEPYALFGDARGDFFAGTIGLGANSIEAKIFSQDGQQGLLTMETRSFTIVDDNPPPPTPPTPPTSGLIFKLFDAASDTAIATLTEGGSINLSQIPNQDLDNLSVQVLAPSFTNAESASLELNGQGVQNESVEPYALFGDARGDFFAGTIGLGANSIEAKIFSQDGQVGLLAEEIRSFTIVDDTTAPTPPPTPGPLLEVGLFDADSDTLIQPLFSGLSLSGFDILNGAVEGVNIAATIPSSSPLAGQVESMRLNFNNGEIVQMENVEPYALFGDARGDFFSGSLPIGNHQLTFELYSQDNLQGTLLATETLNFNVVNTSGMMF